MSSHDDDDRDYDDRPRRRRPRDYDDYDRPKKSGSGGLIIILIVGGVVALGCCGAVGIGLLLPAITKVREAASRAKDSNNLAQIGIAFHNHNDVNQKLPPADGNLSWRVHILPYIEQQNVYKQFDLNQPWDSPANRRLADTRIPTYVSSADPPEFTQTRYRTFVGPGTLYEPGRPPLSLGEIKDGTSDTILAVEAAETVPWPQPKELPFTPNGPLPALGGPRPNIVLVLMVDGSVKAVDRDRLDPNLLRSLITPKGGEQVPRDW